MTKVLSWDVAAKTLSFSLGEYHPENEDGNRFEAHHWEVINLFPEDYDEKLRPIKPPKSDTKTQKGKNAKPMKVPKAKKGHLKKEYTLPFICERLDKELDARPYLISLPDEVIIENQAQRAFGKATQFSGNDFMKRIQVLLCHYFCRYGVRNPNSPIQSVVFIFAGNKLRCYEGPEIEVKATTPYAKNKELGEKHCAYLIRNNDRAKAILESYKNKIGKIDDLCDCFLQMAYHFRREEIAKRDANRKKEQLRIKKEEEKKKKEAEKLKNSKLTKATIEPV